MSSTGSWHDWTSAEWNRRLFQLYFEGDDDSARPVARLVVTPEKLREATGDPGAVPARVHHAFMRAVHLERSAFRKALSRRHLSEAQEWLGEQPPPYFAHLLVTCIAATGTGDQELAQGDFRKRLCQLLEHPQGSQYNLPDLPVLWEALAAWLKRKRAEGVPLRELVLPDPGHMRQIGYSVRLAFPNRRDQLRLAKLLAEQGFDRDPPVREVLTLVQGRLKEFGEVFQNSFEAFRSAFVRGDMDLARFPFWGAVVDAMAADLDESDRSRASFQLILETNENLESELVLLLAGPKPALAEPVQALLCGTFQGEPQHVILIGDDQTATARQLLAGQLEQLVPLLRGSPLTTAVRQGLLIFVMDDSGQRRFSSGWPQEGSVIVLANQRLAGEVARFLNLSGSGRPLESALDWVQLPRVDASALPDAMEVPSPLEKVRALQRSVRTGDISLLGSIRIDGGLLGVSEALPRVHCQTATSISFCKAAPRGSFEVGKATELEPIGNDTFVFPILAALEGRYSFTASRAEGVISQRVVTFRASVLGKDFRQPAKLADWIIEAAGPAHTTPTHDILEGVPSLSKPPKEAPEGQLKARADLLFSTSASIREVEYASSDQPSDKQDGLVEILAALSQRRTGIAEAEFLERFEAALGIREPRLLWDVVRGWVEAGFCDRLLRRRWRGRVYFARAPRFVVAGRRLTLLGLSPRYLRERAASILLARGTRRIESWARSPWVPCPPQWEFEEVGAAESAAKELGLPPPSRLEPHADRIWPFASIVSGQVPEPRHYVLHGVWSWDDSYFAPNRDKVSAREDSIEVEMLCRPDRPDYFRVVRDGQTVWWSYSRNWTLLFAHVAAKRPAFEIKHPDTIFRVSGASVHLPLALGRLATISSHWVPGPSAGGAAYAYPLSEELTSSLNLFLGRDESEDVRHLIRSVLTLARRADRGARYPVPASLRERLRALGFKEATELAAERVPAWMTPRLKHILERKT